PANAAEAKLRELYTAQWDWRQQEFGYEKVEGRWRRTGRLPSVTPEAWDRRAAYWKQALETLDTIPLAELSREEQINAAVFRAAIAADHNNAAWRSWEMPFNSDTFFWGGFNPYQPYQDEADWRRFIARLSDLPRYFDEQVANMRSGLARGWS